MHHPTDRIVHTTAFVTPKEGNVTTFYLRLFDIRHMVKDHPDSKRGNHHYRFYSFLWNPLYAPSHRPLLHQL